MTNFFSLLKNVSIHREMYTEGRRPLWRPSAAYEIRPLPTLPFSFLAVWCSMQDPQPRVGSPAQGGAHGPCSGSVAS